MVCARSAGAILALTLAACHHPGATQPATAGLRRDQKMVARPSAFSEIAAGAIVSGCDPVSLSGNTLAATCAGLRLSATLEGDTIHYGCVAPVTRDTCRIRVVELHTAGHQEAAASGSADDGLQPSARYRIIAIHPRDAYYQDRARYMGTICVSDPPLEPNDEYDAGWYSGDAICTVDGSEVIVTFAAVRVAPI
jgi:hypothetical protein